MDLHSLQEVLLPRTRAELPVWSDDMAALAGGTWLFSEPQPGIATLVDLASLGWELSRFAAPPDWRAADLIGLCCEALLGSFKVWNAATVGGNICLALPAGPMTALAASLGGIATIWGPDGGERQLPVVDLVTGDHRTSLAPGEILRGVLLPLPALRERFAFRRMSLTPLGRSGVLLIGTRDRNGAG
jgi:CO/xanthine dehydrogenase FAD-binding subunit